MPRDTTATTNGGHMAPITHQTEVNSAVIAFLNSIVGSGAPSEMGWK